MRPPKKQYEKIPTGIEVAGVISNIEYDQNRAFKGFDGKPDVKLLGIKLVFSLDGCQYSHGTQWMKLSTHEKSTLYKKYITALVENSTPEMDFDLDVLKGMPIITIWEDNGEYQNLKEIRPAISKMTVELAVEEPSAEPLPEIDLDSPALNTPVGSNLVNPDLESTPF
jgi:hypothetical protein